MAGFRAAADAGSYKRVGELRPGAPLAPFTFRRTASGRRAVSKAERFGLMEEAGLAEARVLAGGAGYAKRGTGTNELEEASGGNAKVKARL